MDILGTLHDSICHLQQTGILVINESIFNVSTYIHSEIRKKENKVHALHSTRREQ